MSHKPLPHTCPECDAAVPDDAPGNLCPKCLMVQAAASTGGDGLPQEAKSPPSLEAVRASFPQLEVQELIGQGGMAAVFKARQPKLNRLVALKILPERLAADPAFAERFAREGQMLARLNHPNIVAVHDFGESGGYYFLLMEFVDGVNVRQALRAGGFTPQQALGIVPKICEALQYAHDEGVLHRDIKPENILLDAKGRVKIADFGIAKFAKQATDSERLTGAGVSLGTPHYMAPEQIDHPSDVDHRADIYSLGVVFYELLTGELPLGRFAPPSEKAAVDARVDDVVLKALERERERRQQTAREVGTEVETITNQPQRPYESKGWQEWWWSVPASRRCVVRAGVALLAMVLLVCFVWPQREVTVTEASTRETLTFGLAKPWLTEVRVFRPHRQQWGELTMATPAFVAGLLAQLLWIILGRLHVAEDAAGHSDLRLVEPYQGRHRIRWRTAALTAFLFAAVSVNAVLLMCAFMQAVLGGAPPVIPTALWTASCCFLAVIVNAIRAGRTTVPTSGTETGMYNPWPRRIFWLIVAVLVVPPLLFAVMLLVPRFAAYAPPPPADRPTEGVSSPFEGPTRLMVDAAGMVTLKARHVTSSPGRPVAVAGAQLDSVLRLLAANDPYQPVFIEPDPKAPSAAVDRLVERCEQAGLKSVLVMTPDSSGALRREEVP